MRQQQRCGSQRSSSWDSDDDDDDLDAAFAAEGGSESQYDRELMRNVAELQANNVSPTPSRAASQESRSLPTYYEIAGGERSRAASQESSLPTYDEIVAEEWSRAGSQESLPTYEQTILKSIA